MVISLSPRKTASHQTGVLVALAFLLVTLGATDARAQDYKPSKPRRQFVTVSLAWLYTHPLHFAEHPLQDLAGSDVAEAQFEDYEYRTRDGSTVIDVLEFRRRSRGAGITVYPLGLSVGPTLGVRGSFEDLPTVRISFSGPGAPGNYALTNGRAYDVGAGLWVADRSSGWGLGSLAFLDAGVGRIRSELGDGRRYFAEAGGGISSGPVGVEFSVKFAWNRLNEPVEHRFFTIPFTLRGTLSF
jgi:hypothetical protein